MKPDAKTIEKLKAEHGELYIFEASGVTLVVRAPSKPAYKRFVEKGNASQYAAAEALVRDCVVWPEAKELDAILERKPGIAPVLALRLAELAGTVEEADFRPL